MFRQIILSCLMLLLGSSLSVFAQTTTPNPFELVHRLPKLTLSTAGDGTATLVSGPRNPFDVVAHRVPGRGQTSVLQKKEERPGSWMPKIALPKGKSSSRSFLFWTLAGVLGYLAFSIAANRSVVLKSWRGFLNENHLALAHRESTGFVGNTPYFLLYVNFLLNTGIFVFLITRFIKGDTYNNVGFLVLCVIGVALIFLLKHSLVYFVGWLFQIGKEAGRYNFLITIFNCVLGLFFVPFNFLIAFARDFEPFLVFWTLGLVVVFYGYRTLRASIIARKFLGTAQFHFLLYLCAAEIAPVLLLYKLATLQQG